MITRQSCEAFKMFSVTRQPAPARRCTLMWILEGAFLSRLESWRLGSLYNIEIHGSESLACPLQFLFWDSYFACVCFAARFQNGSLAAYNLPCRLSSAPRSRRPGPHELGWYRGYVQFVLLFGFRFGNSTKEVPMCLRVAQGAAASSNIQKSSWTWGLNRRDQAEFRPNVFA